MIINFVSIFSVILLGITSTFLFIGQKWRWSMISLALQYLSVFWLVSLVWSLPMSTVKLVVGWMVTAIIGASQPGEDYVEDKFPGNAGVIIRLLSVVMVALVVASLVPFLGSIIQTGMVTLWGGLILIGMGLLQLGMTTRVSRIILGLFTLLAGFEILYAVVERSVLVAGLLAVINLGLAMVGSYLLAIPTWEKTP